MAHSLETLPDHSVASLIDASIHFIADLLTTGTDTMNQSTHILYLCLLVNCWALLITLPKDTRNVQLSFVKLLMLSYRTHWNINPSNFIITKVLTQEPDTIVVGEEWMDPNAKLTSSRYGGFLGQTGPLRATLQLENKTGDPSASVDHLQFFT